mgnify:CR=1 FL=1
MSDTKPAKVPRAVYEPELEQLQRELVKLQEWVHHEGLKVCVLFEGRDTAGKGDMLMIRAATVRHHRSMPSAP